MLPPLDERRAASVAATLTVPESVLDGTAFPVRLDVRVDDPVEKLAIRCPLPAGAAYVAGSTTIDGRTLVDPGRSSPLEADGLLLRDIPAGTRAELAWSVIARRGEDASAVTLCGELDIDGEPHALAAATIALRSRDPFALRPAGFAYHVDGCTVADDGAQTLDVAPLHEPVRFSRDNVRFALHLDQDRRDEIARFVRGGAGLGLTAHVLALRALFPDAATSGEIALAAQLDDARAAVRDVFDRLFVKLRIPGFDVTADDLEDPAMRRALIALVPQLLEVLPGDARFRAALDTLAHARYGAPGVLRILVALIPTACEDEPLLAEALAHYAGALDDVLAAFEDAPVERFDHALTYRRDERLDHALAGVVSALRPVTTTAGLVE